MVSIWYRGVLNRVTENLIPFHCLLELTYRCNLKCLHCYVVRDTQKELTTQQFLSILDQLKELGTLYLIISGGEPLVRTYFFEICKHAKKNNFALRIFTNASLINTNIAERIRELKPLVVEVGLYGFEKTHDEIT
ncbi:MAG: radical SAM protein [Candidatus Omnitrophica bacterium]|nr:radical SAM protein [Candidatus Omnitrophota bacterium]